MEASQRDRSGDAADPRTDWIALRERFERGGARVAGVLSGTSADGITVVLARMRMRAESSRTKNDAGLRGSISPSRTSRDVGVRGSVASSPRSLGSRSSQLRAADSSRSRSGTSSRAPLSTLVFDTPLVHAVETVAFSRDVGRRVRAVLDGETTGLRECALLDRDLGREFGCAARAIADKHGFALDLVGSHGQTVWHHDGVETEGAATLQLGDGDFVAESAGCAVVSDFRQRDVAAGGEGAPLSALADGVIFAALERPCAILNLGGIGNLTVLGASDADVLAFDTGPANSLLDGISRRLLGHPFDAGGACALRGDVDDALVRELTVHPFFERRPPRSTGRDTFGEAWVSRVIERARALGTLSGAHGTERLMASAVELVAQCVARSIDDFVSAPLDRLVVAGGGAHNAALMRALERLTRLRVIASDEIGVPVDAREGLVFAVLAARCVLGIPSTQPGATGAAAGRVLGKISPPSARARTTSRAVRSHRARPERST